MLNTGNAVTDFNHGFSDLQIVFGSPGHFGADHDPLLGETLFPVARADLAATISRPSDLVGQTLIEVATHRSGWRLMLHEMQLPIAPARLLHADSTIMAAALAAEGLGVMLARAPASDAVVAATGLVRCLPDVTIAGQDGYHLVCADRAALRPAARVFRSWLLDHVGGIGREMPAATGQPAKRG
jgi:LysR family glycine cleavage system transcriptional activator